MKYIVLDYLYIIKISGAELNISLFCVTRVLLILGYIQTCLEIVQHRLALRFVGNVISTCGQD